VLPASFGDLPAVDLSGKPDIGDEDVGGPSPAPGQRLLAVGRVDDVEAPSRRASTTNSRMSGSSSTTRTRTEISQLTDLASKIRIANTSACSVVDPR
jgi:hypothetical protein